MVNRNVYRCSGFILVEWLIAIALVLILIVMGSTMSSPRVSSNELDSTTKEVVYTLKKVQLWAMLGHHNERMSQGEFVLKKHAYAIQEGYGGIYEEFPLPNYIESLHSMKRVYFSAYGLPYDGTEFMLQDIRTGKKNRIWISVQTGRIRWESVP